MTETNHPPQSSVDTTPAHDVFSLDFIKVFGNSDPSGFWVDYEVGDSSKPRFYVEVFGDFSDFRESLVDVVLRSKREKVKFEINSRDDLNLILYDKVRLWVKDFIIMHRSDYMVVLKNRGLRWRLWRDSARVRSVSGFICKGFEHSSKRSNVVFLTLTYDRSKYSLVDAWRDLRRRFHRTVRYFKRHYGVKVALGVVEAHEDMYPHLHMIVLFESPVRTFYHKGVKRVCVKKSKWDKVLAREGFVDVFAPTSSRAIFSYLSKYLIKVMVELFKSSDVVGILSNPKALTPFICRVFRIPLVLVYPKGLDKQLYKPTPKPQPLVEEAQLAKAVWDIKYRKPINGVTHDKVEYWIQVKRYLDDTLRDYFSKMIGKEVKQNYDLIYILSSIQSPPNSEFSEWLRSLLYTLHECSKEFVVLGFCEVFVVC